MIGQQDRSKAVIGQEDRSQAVIGQQDVYSPPILSYVELRNDICRHGFFSSNKYIPAKGGGG